MQLTDEQACILDQMVVEWNKAEEDIKIAENVCNNIIIPAVKELRYAGRRVIDALQKSAKGDTEGATRLLGDACFDCHRARHDAIDAATSKIALDIEVMIKKIKYESILPAFPEFHKLVANLNNVRSRISESRGNRESREAIYSLLEASDFAALVRQYNDLRAAEPIMIKLAKRSRGRDALAVVGLVAGVIGTIVSFPSFIAWLKPP